VSTHLQDRVERIRNASKQSSEYWRIRTNDGESLDVFLCPPGDLARIRQHYPGANGEPVSRDQWLA
jgi:hypothetical protein